MCNKLFIAIILCGIVISGCSNDNKTIDGPIPSMTVSVASAGDYSVTLDITLTNAAYTKILCVETTDNSSVTAEDVFENGTRYAGSKIVIEGLGAHTTYTVFAVACNDEGKYGGLQYARFTTGGTLSDMYPWERSRNGLLSSSDMVLCYGGSTHGDRSPYIWDAGRLEPFVTYTDEQGTEHWLFDSFLFIEYEYYSWDEKLWYAFSNGLGLDPQHISADKELWQALIDYWFDDGNGFNALEQSVRQAAGRIGAPSSKRQVVMTMPDPVIYRKWYTSSESTTYWGQMNGRTLDFSKASDRIEACKWYIDEVRRKFNDGNYLHIDLAGFYIVSEELVSPTPGGASGSWEYGWEYAYKKTDEIMPKIASYLNSLNQSLSWIPYNRSAGYKRWQQFGVDYAYMQPGYYWDSSVNMNQFFSDLAAYDLGMELEFDEGILDGQSGSDGYRTRLRGYMSGAKSSGTYGTKPLAYYQGNNALYRLWESTNAVDKQMYHEFCQFVINNPLRK